jgi:hypothetical protein
VRRPQIAHGGHRGVKNAVNLADDLDERVSK